MSILPANIPEHYRFLHPYIRSLTAPQRHAIVQAATTHMQLASTLNTYVLRVSSANQHSSALLRFWASIISEAVAGMLDKSRSGRKGVQQQNEQDIMLRLLPTLNQGLAMKKVPELRVGCYILLAVMASKGGLDDKLITAMMEAVALGWTEETVVPGLECLAVLARHRGAKQLTKRLTKELLKVEGLVSLLVELSKQGMGEKLVNGLCIALVERVKTHGDTSGLPIVVQAIENRLTNDSQTTILVKALLLAAYEINDSTDATGEVRTRLASFLVSISQLAGPVGLLVRDVLKDTEIDIDELEMRLHATIRQAELPADPSKDVKMEDVSSVQNEPNFSAMLAKIPTRTATETSFLAHHTSHIYPELCQAFIASTPNAANLQLFDQSPILRRDSAQEDSLYLSFYAKTWCGPYPVLARALALQMTTLWVSESKTASIDIQGILPYVISALADSASKVRRAAAELLIACEKLYPDSADAKKVAKQYKQWGLTDIYGLGKSTDDVRWLSLDIVVRFLREMLVPALEECVLDPKHVEILFQKSLNSSNSADSPKKPDAKKLPKAARAAILSFLASHATQTPLYLVKLRLLAALNQVRSADRTKALLPVLRHWASLSPADVLKYCHQEKLESSLFDEQALLSIIANDEEGLQFLMDVVRGEIAADRPEFVASVFQRLRFIWPSLHSSTQLKTAQNLLELSQSSENGASQKNASEAATGLLRTVTLSTDILLEFLDQLPTAANLIEQPPAAKRRKTSLGEADRLLPQDSQILTTAIKKINFVLQLVDSAGAENHPELMRSLFNTLAELQHFKSQVSSELAYLQGLVLGGLLSILKAYKRNPNLKMDRSAIRPDLLVDCVQKTALPQVQNSALLLIAALADVAPELVLHSVMPIFTFMGSSVLRQNDDYSFHVVSKTIHEVIPPLIASLRKEKGNPVTGAAELLLSFVAAFEHIPPYRRKVLLSSLIQTMGAEDFLHALMAMLINKYGPTESVQAFAIELSGAFSPEVQLQSAVKYLDLVGDMLKSKPSYSATLLIPNEDNPITSHQAALNELSLLPLVLSQRKLVSQTAKLLDRDDMDAARVRELYATLLEKLLALADTVKAFEDLHGCCGDVLESLLGLLSTSEFVKSVEALLDSPNESLRRKILHSLEVRVDHESVSNTASRSAMLGFLPQLTAIIRESKDTRYKHIAVGCVDKISEKYGKKDLESVAAAAQTIASDRCLGQSDNRLRVMALLCLASLVEILKDGIVPVLPTAIPKALQYMENGMLDGSEGQKLHNAGYAFISSLVEHLPYMISGGYLDQLLVISNKSAEADLDDESDESRVQCLQLSAKKVDAKSMFVALEKDWDAAATAGTLVSLCIYSW